MSSGTVWAEAKPVTSLDDCYGYHTMGTILITVAGRRTRAAR